MKTFHCIIIFVAILLLSSSCTRVEPLREEVILINKWHYDLMSDDFSCFAILARSAKNDPATLELDSMVNHNGENILKSISQVLKKNIKHLQAQKIFKDMPGKNPWGSTGKPVYRKSLPTEMKAMRKLVGGYSGDCSSISQLVIGLCRLNGISEEDIFVVRTRQHSAVLVQYKSVVYLFNTGIEEISWIELLMLNRYIIEGFYNDRYYGKKHTWINIRGLTGPGTLKEKLEKNYRVLFKDNEAGTTGNNTEALIRIALQHKTTDIADIIAASERGPLFKQLCNDCSTIDAMVAWINEKTDTFSIYPYDAFMTPDQVIVFRTATPFDRTIFLWCYCRNKGIPCEILLKDNSYYMRAGGRTFIINEHITETD